MGRFLAEQGCILAAVAVYVTLAKRYTGDRQRLLILAGVMAALAAVIVSIAA